MLRVSCRDVACNLCQSKETRHLYTINSYNVVKCNRCGLVYLNPMPCPADISIIYDTQDYYCNRSSSSDSSTGYPDYIMLSDHLAFVADELMRPLRDRDKGRLLDVGCGMGIMLKHLRERGWDTWGIDISTYATEYARNQLGMNVYTGAVEKTELPQNYFDVVTMVLTIEHVPDPATTLEAIKQLLKHGGIIIVATHDIDGLVPRLVKQKWRHFDIPEHLYYFSRDTLKKMLEKVGLVPFKYTETTSLGAVTGSNSGISTPTGLIRRYGLLAYIAPMMRGYHAIARKLNISDGITVYARK